MAKTYIQKGSSAAVDIMATFGITTKSIPDMKLDAKDIFKRDWIDQQGDSEYIPTIRTFKGYEDSLQFVYKGTLGAAGVAIRTFMAYLAGAEFSIYDEFSGRGFRCRFSGYNPVASYRITEDVIVFEIKVKINNPLSYAVTTIPSSANGMTVYWDNGTTTTLTTGGSAGSTPSIFAIVSPTSL